MTTPSTTTGRLWVIGLGPGDPSLIPPLTWTALKEAEVIIGYAGYFAGLRAPESDVLKGKEIIALPLGEERQRAALAVEKAGAGQAVAVISSGDPGIYGMASLVLETLESRPGLEIDAAVIPGISAINAAASLLGAPLGHDFAVISLSDLLTPWPVIEKRLSAAAAADFVIVLMNPKSRERSWQLERAIAILGQSRLPETPVGIVRNAYRPEQAVTVTQLDALSRAMVDMFTTIIIGNSATRSYGSKLVTPRGYHG
jgi:precorrin-3B C17-methyltransferase